MQEPFYIESDLGHEPDEFWIVFVDEKTKARTKAQHWPMAPAVGDRINLRTGAELVVTGRTIHYDGGLEVEVFVRVEFP